METKVYLIKCFLVKEDSEILKNDTLFIEMAEELGTVYTQEGFISAWEKEGGISSDTHYIRILSV